MITKCYEYKSKICAKGVFRSARLKILSKQVDILRKTTYNIYTDMNLLHEVH